MTKRQRSRGGRSRAACATIAALATFGTLAPEGEAAPAPEPWIARANAQAQGEPLFLVQTKDGGVVARTVSDKVRVPLLGASKPGREALVDGARDLVWLKEADRTYVLDLRAPEPAPIQIARGLPASIPFEVSVGDEGEEHTLDRPSACEPQGRVQLKWGPVSKLEITIDEPAKGKIVGAKWLKDNVSRSTSVPPSVVDFWTVADPEKVSLPAGVARCSGDETCGIGLPFGNAGWKLVLTRLDEGGDCRRLGCVLFDPKTKAFADAKNPALWKSAAKIRAGACGPFYFDPSGRFYLAGRLLCSVGPDAKCTDIGGSSLGWLPPGAAVGAPG